MAISVARGRAAWWHVPGVESVHLPRLAYTHAGKRDLRLDFLKGVAVSMMVVDHVGGNTVLTQLSGGNRSIVSAAEAFVFLSGLVVGMVYGDRCRKAGARIAATGLLRRALTLYRASLTLTLPFLALFLATDLRLWEGRSAERPDIAQSLLGAVTLRYSLQGSDVLIMYALIMIAAPAVLYALHKGHTPLVLAVSAAMWGLFQLSPEATSAIWPVANSSFPIQAWQLLFVAGMALGYHGCKPLAAISSSSARAFWAVGGSAAVLWLLVVSEHSMGQSELPWWLGGSTYGALFLKSTLGPGRVVAFFAALTAGYGLVHYLWLPLSKALGWLILPLGQNSLYVYIAHLFVVVLIYNQAIAVTMLLAPLAFYVDLQMVVNLGSQLLTLGVMWIAVRQRLLFRLIPR